MKNTTTATTTNDASTANAKPRSPLAPPVVIDPKLVQRTGTTVFLRPADIQTDIMHNPRRFLPSPKQVQVMADSLLEGQLQPIGIRPSTNPKDTRPMVAYGYTRHAAAIKLTEDGIGPDLDGVFLLECKWEERTDKDQFIAAFRENLDRNELSPMDCSHAYQVLKDEYGLSQTQISEMASVSNATVSLYLKLQKLIPKAQRMIHSGVMSVDAGLEIAGSTPEEQDHVLELLKTKGKKPSKSDTREAAGETQENDQQSDKPIKAKTQTMKTALKLIRENFNPEVLEAEGWPDDYPARIAALFDTFCSWGSGIPVKGKRKPATFAKFVEQFGKLLS